MYLWDAGLERRQAEESSAWVRAYTTTRDALIGVEEMRGGGKAFVPEYVKPHLAPPTVPTTASLETQLKSLAVIFPNNIDLGESRA